MNTNEWKQDEKADTDQWNLPMDGAAGYCYGHISNYAGTNRYCWQAVRGDLRFRLSGIVEGREAAMAKADEALALPIDEFNTIVAGELREKLTELEQQLLFLQPGAQFLPGYHAGYEAGAADVKRKIAEALSEDA